ncbi:FAR-17a/AIG1-like protein [Tranquillimonas rosea]|uniref:FAR-17a/AIG1-like protein n=1 Tax=Tranquillimonas rosea TaxID=641238 RepID=A0A1H9UKX4_9RHOB|nr:hypothetical protein [Tranquillimonas rosea]SES09999.1 FAR-17a/AIG1-like protein [Tranquillimonas rosea]
MTPAASRRAAFRGAAFALALGYWLYQFPAAPDTFGGQFRFLTIWALTGSVLSFAATLRLSLGGGRAPATLVAVAAVVNALVVLLYWRLYFTDPALVNGGNAIDPWQEYYLHFAGPLLQWIDALVLLGAFRRPGRIAVVLAAVIVAYLGWSEWIVAPLSDRPVGRVTTGLPYPFLNDMAAAERIVFYAKASLTALIFVGAGWGLTRLGAHLVRAG